MISHRFNPLGIGSFCISDEGLYFYTVDVSIPLESGHFVLETITMNHSYLVSIPLESGHFVFYEKINS